MHVTFVQLCASYFKSESYFSKWQADDNTSLLCNCGAVVLIIQWKAGISSMKIKLHAIQFVIALVSFITVAQFNFVCVAHLALYWSYLICYVKKYKNIDWGTWANCLPQFSSCCWSVWRNLIVWKFACVVIQAYTISFRQVNYSVCGQQTIAHYFATDLQSFTLNKNCWEVF